MKSTIPIISRFLRYLDRRHSYLNYPSIPTTGITIYAINKAYRARHYWQENRGRG